METERRANWPELAEKLVRRFPVSKFHRSVLRWIELNPGKDPVGIAFSGGADSLSLLLLLWQHFPDWRNRLHVLHFDHKLRGSESAADREFVENVAEAFDLPISVGEWIRLKDEPVTEESARLARLDFFYQVLRKISDRPPVVFFGHQRDDVLENVLMRLSRGSGIGGLSGPRPVQCFRDGRVHLRPLLELSVERIERALAELEIPFRVDSTNLRPGFYRNRLRNEVIPAWEKASPFEVGRGAALSRELLEEDDSALRDWLRELIPEIENRDELDFRLLRGRPKALFRRALNEWLLNKNLLPSLQRSAIELLLDALEKEEPIAISAGSEVRLEVGAEGVLRIEKLEGEAPAAFLETWPLPLDGAILLSDGKELRARKMQLEDSLRKEILEGRGDERTSAFIAFEGGDFSVRNWRAGDRYRPLGAPGSRKLQDLFTDRKISGKERRGLPVVFLNNKLTWIPGFPPADELRIDSSTKVVVRLTYS